MRQVEDKAYGLNGALKIQSRFALALDTAKEAWQQFLSQHKLNMPNIFKKCNKIGDVAQKSAMSSVHKVLGSIPSTTEYDKYRGISFYY